MAQNDGRKRQNLTTGFTLPELLGILAILAVVSAIFFPVYQNSRGIPNGKVLDSVGKPLPSAVLRFRDQTGRLIATLTADDNGSFRRPGLDALSRNAVDGFGLTRANYRTGAGTLYTFTPLGTHIATFRDTSGNAVPGLAVVVSPDRRTWQWDFHEPFEQVSDNKGEIRAVDMPLGGRFAFLSQDARFVVKQSQAIARQNTIRYTVTVTGPATITGRLIGQNGKPLRGYKVFATVSPDLDHFERHYADYLVTGLNGRFRILGLLPRTYYVSATPARKYHASIPAQRITVSSDQTAVVTLRASPSASHSQ